MRAPSRPRHPQTGQPLLKMAELVERSGLTVATIGFYVREGVVPEPVVRSSRNMAWYGEETVQALTLVRALQHDRHLPLSVIRAIVHGDAEDPRLHTAARAVVPGPPAAKTATTEVPAERTLEFWLQRGVLQAEVDALADLSVLSERPGPGPLPPADAGMLDLLVEARAAGLGANVLSVEALGAYRSAVAELARFEVGLFRQSVLSALAPDDHAAAEAAVRISEQFVVQCRRALLLPALFSEVGALA
ncbi:MAG: MerR family transcriptional regulator [Deltaproteobacteria bacterium]|nr:MerR family transcriptional regulator [Deltaproteobacteria bacterium]